MMILDLDTYYVYKNMHNFWNMCDSFGEPTLICEPKERNDGWKFLEVLAYIKWENKLDNSVLLCNNLF